MDGHFHFIVSRCKLKHSKACSSPDSLSGWEHFTLYTNPDPGKLHPRLRLRWAILQICFLMFFSKMKKIFCKNDLLHCIHWTSFKFQGSQSIAKIYDIAFSILWSPSSVLFSRLRQVNSVRLPHQVWPGPGSTLRMCETKNWFFIYDNPFSLNSKSQSSHETQSHCTLSLKAQVQLPLNTISWRITLYLTYFWQTYKLQIVASQCSLQCLQIDLIILQFCLECF